MSQRTIIELNHDYCQTLGEDLQKLVTILGTASEKELKELARNGDGIRVIAQRHHSDPIKVSINKVEVIW